MDRDSGPRSSYRFRSALTASRCVSSHAPRRSAAAGDRATMIAIDNMNVRIASGRIFFARTGRVSGAHGSSQPIEPHQQGAHRANQHRSHRLPLSARHPRERRSPPMSTSNFMLQARSRQTIRPAASPCGSRTPTITIKSAPMRWKIILPAYLIEIGYNPFQIGLVATAALLGSAALTLAIGFFAPRHDLRTLLIARRRPDGRHRARVSERGTSPSSRWSPSSARSTPRPATSACWCRSSTPCWRRASPTATAPRVRALQPDRRAVERRRRARGTVPDLLVAAGIDKLAAFRPCSTPMRRSG